MKVIAYIILMSALFGCSANNISSKIEIIDSHGDKYSINTAATVMQKSYDLDEAPMIIVLVTATDRNVKFKDQMNVLSKVDPEEMQYMYVIANSEIENHSGYYIDKADAKNLLDGNLFKIIIYDRDGVILRESASTISENDLLSYLTKSSSKTSEPE